MVPYLSLGLCFAHRGVDPVRAPREGAEDIGQRVTSERPARRYVADAITSGSGVTVAPRIEAVSVKGALFSQIGGAARFDDDLPDPGLRVGRWCDCLGCLFYTHEPADGGCSTRSSWRSESMLTP